MKVGDFLIASHTYLHIYNSVVKKYLNERIDCWTQ